MRRVRLSRRPVFRLLAVASSKLVLSADTAAGSNAPHHQEGLATLPGVGVAHRLGGLSSRRDWWVLSLLGFLGREGDPEAVAASLAVVRELPCRLVSPSAIHTAMVAFV